MADFIPANWLALHPDATAEEYNAALSAMGSASSTAVTTAMLSLNDAIGKDPDTVVDRAQDSAASSAGIIAGSPVQVGSVAVAVYPTLPEATIGSPYQVVFEGQGSGDVEYIFAWNPNSDPLPNGLAFDTETGELSGTVGESVTEGNFAVWIDTYCTGSEVVTTTQFVLPVIPPA